MRFYEDTILYGMVCFFFNSAIFLFHSHFLFLFHPHCFHLPAGQRKNIDGHPIPLEVSLEV